jgi:hypothetical protein
LLKLSENKRHKAGCCAALMEQTLSHLCDLAGWL